MTIIDYLQCALAFVGTYVLLEWTSQAVRAARAARDRTPFEAEAEALLREAEDALNELGRQSDPVTLEQLADWSDRVGRMRSAVDDLRQRLAEAPKPDWAIRWKHFAEPTWHFTDSLYEEVAIEIGRATYARFRRRGHHTGLAIRIEQNGVTLYNEDSPEICEGGE